MQIRKLEPQVTQVLRGILYLTYFCIIQKLIFFGLKWLSLIKIKSQTPQFVIKSPPRFSWVPSLQNNCWGNYSRVIWTQKFEFTKIKKFYKIIFVLFKILIIFLTFIPIIFPNLKTYSRTHTNMYSCTYAYISVRLLTSVKLKKNFLKIGKFFRLVPFIFLWLCYEIVNRCGIPLTLSWILHPK